MNIELPKHIYMILSSKSRTGGSRRYKLLAAVDDQIKDVTSFVYVIMGQPLGRDVIPEWVAEIHWQAHKDPHDLKRQLLKATRKDYVVQVIE